MLSFLLERGKVNWTKEIFSLEVVIILFCKKVYNEIKIRLLKLIREMISLNYLSTNEVL